MFVRDLLSELKVEIIKGINIGSVHKGMWANAMLKNALKLSGTKAKSKGIVTLRSWIPNALITAPKCYADSAIQHYE